MVNNFMEYTKQIADQSTCLKRHVGAIIIKDDVILSTGYNKTDCIACSRCGAITGTDYKDCFSIHAEDMAINGQDYTDATLYCTYEPCLRCAQLIIEAGITKVHLGSTKDYFGILTLLDAGIRVFGDEGCMSTL